MIGWILCLFSVASFPPEVNRVRQGFLSYAPNAEISLIFENYKHFESFKWQLDGTGTEANMVIFTGEIDDAAAVQAFEENNQFKLKFSFKAMQLQPTYGLTAEKTKLAFVIRFQILEEGFKVDSGALGIYTESIGWEYRPFADKALAAAIEGIYRNRDPYTALVMGLPYK